MNATRQGDCCTGHDSCPPVPLVEFSPNVNINGRGAGRVGDHYASHGCVAHPGHQDVISAGSSTVSINGRPAGRAVSSSTARASLRSSRTYRSGTEAAMFLSGGETGV